ncbi:hypothetical protein E3E14_05145 [Streptomyces sp. ICN441]|uniref:Secreted protein n=1 Tax=Streptomyces tirandamycinicus TaxID=2174846 RepID=A0A2S1SRB3_9ACTN|nr:MULTISPECIES: hypothetical protein [Streptomyces]AWI28926.1 hypothetical protein DDW44_09120 [Streptomyces tirandamycinicus]MCY0984013.1 hypothetical protein [Streptomyces tirandamycinicus]NNJ04122.1 hypothetical protein [Streptomyces sp. PKU-MA01144]TFE56090.1 hypothetical protein E3E14_05145 [Streptomyces sp. ICN441]
MARMLRALVHAAAWSLATGAAVALSWWGVHTVMVGTAYDRPRALPIAADARTPQASAPQSPATRDPGVPEPEPEPEPSSGGEPGDGGGSPVGTPPAGKPAATPGGSKRPWSPPPSGNVKSYTVEGGRVAFDIGPGSAELVSATPSGSWTMQIWKQPTYIRVTFSQNGREIDVFCTWHDTAPRVEIEER